MSDMVGSPNSSFLSCEGSYFCHFKIIYVIDIDAHAILDNFFSVLWQHMICFKSYM